MSKFLGTALEIEVKNARSPSAGVLTAGQPSQVQLEALHTAGVTHFISLRPATEDGAGWEEDHHAAATGADYIFHRLPISGASSLTRENVDTFAALLREAGETEIMIYCGSSNRVGAMLALKAQWIDAVSADEALQVGIASGMTSLEAPVRALLGMP